MDKDIEVLLKKADQNIKGATVLYEEGIFGFAVSRAHYSMFYLIKAIMLAQGLDVSRYNAVTSSFGQHFIKMNLFDRKFDRYVMEAFKQRRAEDDEELEKVTREMARNSIDRAEEFYKAVTNYLIREGMISS